jgi:hypothetical protein
MTTPPPRGHGLERSHLKPHSLARSALALTYRLRDLEMLTEWHYRQTCIELGRRGYKTGEPDGIDRESSKLLDKVFRALRMKGITPKQVANELHIPIEMLGEFVSVSL